MRYLSVCSGIEAATAAWHPLGWEPVAFSEVDAFPSAVLKHHYPSVPNWGDMTKFQEWPDADVDVLVGGTPCQSFSVAGLRKGLDDPRGNLMLVYLALADRYRPEWLVWENVPGVLSSNEGRDFGAFLGGLAELGYGWAYRVLDAQYFGLAQRRRRVFVVASARGWQRAAAVLFERESLSGHPAPRRASGKVAPTVPARRTAGGGDLDYDGGLIASDVAPTLTKSGCGVRGPGHNEDGFYIGVGRTIQGADVFPCLDAMMDQKFGSNQWVDSGQAVLAHTLTKSVGVTEDGTGRGTPVVPAVAPCLTSNYGKQPDSSDTNAGPMLVPVAWDEELNPSVDVAGTIVRGGNGGRHDGVAVPVAHAFDARQSDVLQYGDQTGPLDTDGSSIGVMTLAIRGRADGAQLEVREDGTSNAILTPSGVRGGIGVGAVAFTQNQRDEVRALEVVGALSAERGMKQQTYLATEGGIAFDTYNQSIDGDVTHTLRTDQAPHIFNAAMAVRRLTPRECERLQGFPDDTKTITIRVCRSEDERRALALSAAKSSVAPKLEPSRHVAVDVRIDLERRHLQLRSLGKSNLSVSFADAASSSPLSIPLADFARLVAVTTSTLARETRTGEVASLLTINRSSAPWDGSVFVHLCGREIEELANDAEQFTTALSRSTKFITSEAGRSSQNSEQTLRTLCSCVAAVIASFIPEAIRAGSSFDLRLTTIRGYTLIPYGKPSKRKLDADFLKYQLRGNPKHLKRDDIDRLAADGPRYKALGNSMAVPVMAWIGKRIQTVEEL